MIKTRILPALVVAAMAMPGAAMAAGGKTVVNDTSFSFEGPFGTYDKHQLQRGFQIYHQICRNCHGLKYLAFRDLGRSDGPGFPEEQIKAIAAEYEVAAEVGEPYTTADGEKVDKAEAGDLRPGKASDLFPANTSQGAPDLTLMAKARAGFHGPSGLMINQLFKGGGGPEYIYSLMTGYVDPPECATGVDMGIAVYNTAFAPGAYPDECKIFEETVVAILDEDGEPVMGDDGKPKTRIDKKEIGRKAPGSWIIMGEQLAEGAVEYAMHGGDDHADEGDDHGAKVEAPKATPEQMAKDVSAFLMWAAEPTMTERKSAGFRNIIMILVLAVLLYYTNKKLWAPIKRKD